MKKFLILVMTLLLVGLIFLSIDVYRKVYKPYKGYYDSVRLLIKKGSSVDRIGEDLVKHKVIASTLYFKIFYRLFFKNLKLQSGEYIFNRPMTMSEVIHKLHKGDVVLYKITIKEGMTRFEIGGLIEHTHQIPAQEFDEASRDVRIIQDIDSEAQDLEGYLYPDTYIVDRNIGAEEFVNMMIRHFKKNLSEDMKNQADEIGFSIRDTVILASLIEKETASTEERFRISSVFHNRLKKKMPLACDPSIVYILKRENRYQGTLRWKDLKYDSPYNTRLFAGLPPGPICSPGIASIEAALYPEETDYLYFVAKDSKSHYFSKTLREHNWAVRKYIINKKD